MAVRMIPIEEYYIVEKTIKDNISLPHDKIVEIIGKDYYNVYKMEIDNLIDKHLNKPYLKKDHTFMFNKPSDYLKQPDDSN